MLWISNDQSENAYPRLLDLAFDIIYFLLPSFHRHRQLLDLGRF